MLFFFSKRQGIMQYDTIPIHIFQYTHVKMNFFFHFISFMYFTIFSAIFMNEKKRASGSERNNMQCKWNEYCFRNTKYEKKNYSTQIVCYDFLLPSFILAHVDVFIYLFFQNVF